MIHSGIFQQVTALRCYQQAQTIFLYCSTEEEIDTWCFLEDLLQKGKRVCVPLCTDTKGVMEARELRHRSQLLPGRFGIPEPPSDSPVVPPEEIALCIVPCLAADLEGNRLGYGGGYYDRFLAQTSAQKVALCVHRLLVDRLPAEPHDQKCGMVATERRVHIASKK